MGKNYTVILQWWRDALVALSVWLLLAYSANSLLNGFVELLWPLRLLSWVWVGNVLAWWYLQSGAGQMDKSVLESSK